MKINKSILGFMVIIAMSLIFLSACSDNNKTVSQKVNSERGNISLPESVKEFPDSLFSQFIRFLQSVFVTISTFSIFLFVWC